MITKTRRYRKPDLLLLLAVFVGTGFLATSLTQAAEPGDLLALDSKDDQSGHSESWWRSIWGMDLTRKLKEWHPKIRVEEDAEGLNLARPFGKTGPGLQLSSSLPVSVQRSLRDGGDNRIGALGSDTDAYIFLQKRW
jgi:hypothetical protein